MYRLFQVAGLSVDFGAGTRDAEVVLLGHTKIVSPSAVVYSAD